MNTLVLNEKDGQLGFAVIQENPIGLDERGDLIDHGSIRLPVDPSDWPQILFEAVTHAVRFREVTALCADADAMPKAKELAEILQLEFHNQIIEEGTQVDADALPWLWHLPRNLILNQAHADALGHGYLYLHDPARIMGTATHAEKQATEKPATTEKKAVAQKAKKPAQKKPKAKGKTKWRK